MNLGARSKFHTAPSGPAHDSGVGSRVSTVRFHWNLRRRVTGKSTSWRYASQPAGFVMARSIVWAEATKVLMCAASRMSITFAIVANLIVGFKAAYLERNAFIRI